MKYKEEIQVIVLRIFISCIVALVFRILNPEIIPLSVIGIGVFINYCLSFFHKLGRTVPIRELIILIALLQWVVAPVASYHFFTTSEFYSMCISEERYMSFAVPATLAMIAGLLFPFSLGKELNQEEHQIENPEYFFKRGRLLVIIGFFAILLSRFVPVSLRYLFVLLSNTSFLGVFYFLRTQNRLRYLLIVAAFAPVFINAAQTSIFHELFIWGGFTLILFTYTNKTGTIP